MIVLPDLMMITFRTLLFANLIMVIFSRYRELLLRVLMLLLLYNPRGEVIARAYAALIFRCAWNRIGAYYPVRYRRHISLKQ